MPAKKRFPDRWRSLIMTRRGSTLSMRLGSGHRCSTLDLLESRSS